MKYILSVCILLAFLNASAGSDTSKITDVTYTALERGITLSHSWRYKAGDDIAWAAAGYNDSNWQRVNDTKLEVWMADSKEHIDFKGIGWFRMHINIDEASTNTPLALGISQYGASEIFIDGKMVGGYGVVGRNHAESKYFNPEESPLMFVLDTPGRHVIAIRYANYKMSTGEINEILESTGFSVKMGTGNDMSDDHIHNIIYSGFILLCLAGFFMALCFVHFVLWLYHKKDKANLFFSIFSLAVATFLFTTHMEEIPLSVDVYDASGYCNYSAMLAIFISLSGLTNYLFSKRKIFFYVIISMGLLALLSVILKISEYSLTVLLMAFWISAIIESIILTLIALSRRQHGAKIVGVGVLLFMLLILVLAVTFVIATTKDDRVIITMDDAMGVAVVLIALATLLCIPVSMSIYLAWNFATISKTIIKQEKERQHLLETQNERLETEVKERTHEIATEKQKSDELLRNILPEEIAEELKQKGSSAARYYDNVSVIFTDFVDFTKAGMRLTPQQLVSELDTCFKAFDEITAKYNIEKIKTIGDAYLAVCGLPTADTDHAVKTVNAALDIMSYMQERKKLFPDTTFDIRIGIHSGTVVAGIVGLKKFAYDIWGDTVNTAARMESSSESNRINISQATYNLVQHEFNCIYRGEILAKNKGDMHMYFVEGKK